MKKILGSIKNRKGGTEQPSSNAGVVAAGGAPKPPQGDHIEAVVAREVIAFCESGAPGSASAGEEYLHLPAIVDGAESSPAAAKEASLYVKRYLGKDQYDRGFAQYNAIMLTRILTDNPGRNFTQNFDKDFVQTVKKMLRESQDVSVQQILRETLDYFAQEKVAANDSLVPLMEMWGREKGLPPRAPQGQYYMNRGPSASSRQRSLPPPAELAGRIEEAKTTARLLLQTIQSTPANELPRNDLVAEFASRAKSAQNSIAKLMACDSPPPDDETMLTLIETNEQLNIAMSKHQRALLQAKRTTPSPQPQPGSTDYMAAGERVYGQTAQGPNLSVPPTGQSRFGQPQSIPNEQYAAPSGPPPGARGAVRDSMQTHATPNTEQKETPENPFTDDADYEEPQKSHSLFGKPNNVQISQPEYTAYRPSVPTVTSTIPEPAAPRSGQYIPTQSYMHRQESAANNITMHGASPPPGASR